MKDFRLKRLFNAKSGRCFDVAVDHGFFNQPGFLQGIESMPKVIQTLVDAAPDAIQLTLGQARHLQSIPGRQKPSLVLRTDVANIYGKELPDEPLQPHAGGMHAAGGAHGCGLRLREPLPNSRRAGGA